MTEESNMYDTASRGQNLAAAGGTRISVIIPVLNEEKVIGRCLDALRQMDFARQMFEVIIVDNGSQDNTASIALGFSSILNLRIVEKKKVSISALRNFGAAQAQGDIFAFLDADCLPPQNWLSDAFSLLDENSQQIVGARYRIPDNSSWIARAWFQDRETKHKELVSYVPSGNLILSSSNFLLIGGFDEELATNEDYDFCRRADAQGLQIFACPDIAVIHLGTPQNLGHFYRKQRWHGTHVFRVFLRDPEHRQNAKAVAFTLYMSVCLLLCFVGVIALSMRHPSLLLLAISASLLGPLLLSLADVLRGKRLKYFGTLVLLYATFGVARCASLLNPKSWQSAS